MNSHHNSHSKNIIHQPLELPHLPPPFKRALEILTHYDTPKIVRFESKWIATLSFMVKLIFAIVCVYLMLQRSSYQVFDHSPISAVIINVEASQKCSENASIMEHFKDYNCEQSAYDVNDFILPAIENSAVSITTRITEIEYILRYCNNETIRKKGSKHSSKYAGTIHHCYNRSQCILPPFYRSYYENEAIVRKPQLCWFKLPHENNRTNYQALNYILFIKNFVEFPQLKTSHDNLLAGIKNKNYVETCEYDNKNEPLCPKFRVLKILEMVEKNATKYESMFIDGALIEIKIKWDCNLDRNIKHCEPKYEFQRLDNYTHPHPQDKDTNRGHQLRPGSTFFTQRSFFQPNSDQLHRVHTDIYNLHFIVSVTGAVGKLDLFQTTTSIGSFIGIFSTGKIVCDLIAAFITNFKRVKYES